MNRLGKTRLLLVDNHDGIHAGVRSLLDGTDIELVAGATTGNEALIKLRTQTFDVVLLGHTREQREEMELSRIRREFPQLPILVFSAYEQPLSMAQALLAGANGYLLKGSSRAEILDMVERGASGESCWLPEQIEQIAGTPDSESRFPLTRTERELLWQLGHGRSGRELAKRLGIGLAVLHGIYRNLRRKLNSFGCLVSN